MRVKAENLAAKRGGVLVFSGLCFSLEEGECLVVTGPNGSGKSSMLRVLGGLLAPEEGSVTLEDGGGTWPDLASAAHYLGHRNAMKEGLTVGENLAFWRSFLGEPALTTGAALEALDLRGVDDIPFGYLSAGQRRRAAIARLLVSRRPVWLLDEPTAGLDDRSAARFTGLMREHLGSGGMIAAATHVDLGVAGKGLEMGEGLSC